MLKRTRDAHTPRCTSGDCSHSAAPPRHAKCCGTARAGIRTCLYMSMRPARARTCALRERSTTRPTPAPHLPAQPHPELQSQFASAELRHPRPLHAAAYRACPYISGGSPNRPEPLPRSRRSPSSSSLPNQRQRPLPPRGPSWRLPKQPGAARAGRTRTATPTARAPRTTRPHPSGRRPQLLTCAA